MTRSFFATLVGSGLILLTSIIAKASVDPQYLCHSLSHTTENAMDLVIGMNADSELVAEIDYKISLGSRNRWKTMISFDEETSTFVGANFSLSQDTLSEDRSFSGLLKVNHGLARFNGTVLCHYQIAPEQ